MHVTQRRDGVQGILVGMRNRRYITAPPESGLLDVEGSWAPSVLQLIRARRDPIGFGEIRRARYGEVGATRFFGTNMVMATGAEAAEEILTNRDGAFSSSGWDFVIGPFFGGGLMLMDPPEHLRHRRIMAQAFTPAAMRTYFPKMQEVIVTRLDELRPGTTKLYPLFKQLSFDTAFEVFVNIDLSAQDRRRVQAAFTDTVRAGTSLVRIPIPRSRYRRGQAGRRILEEFFNEHLAAKRRGDGTDLFTRLATTDVDGERLSDAEIVNHMIFLLMAAHDTTQVALTQTGYQLAAHPEWQERCREEISGRPLGFETVSAAALPTLDRVVREAIRICPPVTVYPRMVVADTQVLGRYLPVGTRVSVPALTNHRNPAVWPDPHTFDPDRFLPERLSTVHKFAWTPFGGGAHQCLGMVLAMNEIRLVFAEILLRFELAVPRGYIAPMDYSAIPIPKDGLPVNLTPRVQAQ